jgi:hypothetical protein
MSDEKPVSRLVRRVMLDAADAEIEEATRRWFGFLDTLYDIVLEREQQERDSHNCQEGDRFDEKKKNI